MRRSLWLGSIALLCSPISARSQEVGSRIRITESAAAGLGRHSGTLVSAGADTVIMRLDRGGDTVKYPVSGVSHFEVSQGRKGNTLRGALIGVVVGGVAGGVIGRSECGSGCTGEENLGALSALIGVGVGGGGGLIVGALVGSSIKTDRWEEVPSSRWRVSASPGAGGFRVGLSMQF